MLIQGVKGGTGPVEIDTRKRKKKKKNNREEERRYSRE